MVPPYGLWLRQAEVVEPEGAGAVVLQVDADANGAGRRNIGPGQRAPRAGAGEGQRGAAELHPVRVVARQRDVPRAGRGAGASLPAAIGVAQPWGNRDILSAPLPGQPRVPQRSSGFGLRELSPVCAWAGLVSVRDAASRCQEALPLSKPGLRTRF